MSRIYHYLPDDISSSQWINLLELNSPKTRFEYYNFLRQKKFRSEKDEIKRLLRKSSRTMNDKKVVSNDIYDERNFLYFSSQKRSRLFIYRNNLIARILLGNNRITIARNNIMKYLNYLIC